MRRVAHVCLLALVAALAACDLQESENPERFPLDAGAGCAYAPCVCRVQATAMVPPSVSAAPLVVQGTAKSDDHGAIHAVVVASKSASSVDFNYRTWTVTLDRAALEALPRVRGADDGGPGGDLVELPIRVVDQWGRTCVQQDPVTFELLLPAAELNATSAATPAAPGAADPASAADDDAGTPRD